MKSTRKPTVFNRGMNRLVNLGFIWGFSPYLWWNHI